jgi:hypothetical protein
MAEALPDLYFFKPLNSHEIFSNSLSKHFSTPTTK